MIIIAHNKTHKTDNSNTIKINHTHTQCMAFNWLLFIGIEEGALSQQDWACHSKIAHASSIAKPSILCYYCIHILCFHKTSPWNSTFLDYVLLFDWLAWLANAFLSLLFCHFPLCCCSHNFSLPQIWSFDPQPWLKR